MKHLTFFLFLFFSITSTNGQTTADFEGEISWSELFKVNRKVGSPEIIGQDGTHVYIIRYIKKKQFLQKYKLSNLSLVSSVLLSIEYNGKRLTIIDQFMFNETPVIHTSLFDSKKRKTYTFLQSINPKSLVISRPTKLSELDVPKRKGFIKVTPLSVRMGTSNPIIISEDGQLAFINTGGISQEAKNGTEIVSNRNGKLLDADFEVLFESDYKLPYVNFEILETKLSNDGLLYIAGHQIERVKNTYRLHTRTSLIKGDLEIFVLDIETGDMESLKVDLDGKIIEGFTFKIAEDGSIIVSGLTGIEGSGVSGTFYASYEPDLSEIGISYTDFEPDFITTSWSKKAKKKLERKQNNDKKKGKEKTKPEFYDYIIKDLILKEDGTVTLLAEQFYIKVVTTTSTNASGQTTTRTTYYYYYNDIIVVNFDEDGEMAWKTLVKKRQVSTNDGGYYSSFFTLVNGNEISIIYNDRESNTVSTEGMTNAEIRKLKKNTIGKRVIIHENGEITHEKLFEFEERGLRIVPKVCSQINHEFVFLYARSYNGG